MTKKLNLRLKDSSTPRDDSEQLYDKKIQDLESINEALKCDVEELRSKLADVSINSSIGTLQSSREFSQKSIATKEEGMSSRSKSNLRSMCSTKKYKTESSVKQFDGEVQKLKAQKVKLQCKIKLDSMQFRLLKASLEKEVLQLKKELRKSEFEKHVLSALNNRQKLILQLKNTQALTAMKRLKMLLQSKKISSNKTKGPPKGTSSGIQESSNEIGLLTKLNKIHSDYERQMKEIAEEVKRFSLEAGVLKSEFEGEQNSCSASCDNQMNHTPMDSELKELKQEFNKLSTLVSQMEMTKSQFSETDKVQGEPVEHSISSKNTDHQSNSEPSQPEDSVETLCKKEQSKAEVCCSCTKKSLCKTKNCQCRAKGSGCGDSCGCLASKCSNREDDVKPDKEILRPVDGKKPSGISHEAHDDDVKPDKAILRPVDGKKPSGISHEAHDDKDANKKPLRDIGNIQEAVKVGKLRKVQKRVAKK